MKIVNKFNEVERSLNETLNQVYDNTFKKYYNILVYEVCELVLAAAEYQEQYNSNSLLNKAAWYTQALADIEKDFFIKNT